MISGIYAEEAAVRNKGQMPFTATGAGPAVLRAPRRFSKVCGQSRSSARTLDFAGEWRFRSSLVACRAEISARAWDGPGLLGSRSTVG